MTTSQRIWLVIRALVKTVAVGLMLAKPESGYYFVVLILDVWLLFYGFRLLFFYILLARYKVDGISNLYKGIFVIDLGLFALGLSSMPQKYVMIFLIVFYGFAGIRSLIEAVGAGIIRSKGWKRPFFGSAVKIIIAVICACNLNSMTVATYCFSIGIVISAIGDVDTALHKKSIVYIEP